MELPISADLKLAFKKAHSIADAHKCSVVRTEHLLLALVTKTTSHAAVVLGEADASLPSLEQLVSGIKDHGDQDYARFSSKELDSLMGV
jgi:ATP-dependent Clp protease ATP-binding subunit ClpA